MAVELDPNNFRCPDAAIYCDPRDTGPEARDKQRLHHPKVIFEVLSPSTSKRDRVIKVAEYKAVPSIATIVLVDLDTRTIELHERTGPAAWTQREVAAGEDLVLTDPRVTLTAAEIFGDA
jgi:Uma2 family endonuclease